MRVINKYIHVRINIQQGIVYDSQDHPNHECAVAIYSIHNQVIVILPHLKGDYSAIMESIPKERKERLTKLIYGDGFNLDTWDNKIVESSK